MAWAVEVLCRWPRCCVGGRGAVSVVDALCVWSRSCALVDVLRGVSDASREVPVLLRLLGVVSLRSF